MQKWWQWLAGAVVATATTTASAFPNVWEPVISTDGDAIQDTVGDSSAGDPRLDVVGTPQDPALFMAVDAANNINLRIRLDGDPRGMPFLIDGAWSVIVDLDGDDLNYEALLRINGGMNRVEGWLNTNGTNQGSMIDPPDLFAFAQPLVDEENVRVRAAQTQFGGSPDFFLDVSIPIAAFNGLIQVGTPVRVVAGTSPSPASGLTFDATEGPNLGTLAEHLSAPYIIAGENIALCGNGMLEPGEQCDDGNLIGGDGCDAVCQLEGQGEFAIVEVMQDPASVADGLGEWFEVKNIGDTDADLSGYSFVDEASDTFVIMGALPVAVGESVVLGRYADQGINGGVALDYAYGAGMSLANGPDRIVLLSPNGVELDRVEWDGGATWPNPRGRGRSMQFGSDYDVIVDDNNDPAFWCRPVTEMANGDLGTPGAENDPCGAVDLGTVVITEIMQDPASVADGLGEWFEVHNPGDAVVDLNGWRFVDSGSDSFTVMGSVSIPAGGYAVLARHADPGINGGLTVDYAYGTSMLLANSVDSIIAYNPANVEVDRVEWDGGATWPNPRGRGRSMQVDGDADLASVDNNDPSQWCRPSMVMANGDLGTPGAANDSCGPAPDPGTVVITEIMQDPASVADGLGEWFEVYNPGNTPVDLNGWTFEDGNTDSFVVSASVVIAPGGYAVLARHPAEINGGVAADYTYGTSMLLANSADGIIVRDATGTEIDRVEWDTGTSWPNPRGRGRSMQVDGGADLSSVDNNDPNQWCRPSTVMANGDEGTPGAANDPCGGGGVCGNGLLEFGEACDDNNTTNGDGCDARCQGESIITIVEVMQDPMVVADGLGEWFEVHNPTPVDIDLNGWTFSDNGSDSFTVDSALIVPANGYAVLGKFTDMAINGGVAVDYAFGPSMVLANQPDGIILTDATGVEIDRVEWGAGWPNPRGRGRSMQFGQQWDSIVDDNNDSTHWCRPTSTMGNGELGTPGGMNDLCP